MVALENFVVRELRYEDAALIESGTLGSLWGDDNGMAQYHPEGLQKFFSNPMSIMVGAIHNQALAALAIAHTHPHPNTHESELYLHELDTRPDYRRLGIARDVMRHLLELAQVHALATVWLVTEHDNLVANKFYTSLGAAEAETTRTYTFPAKSEL